MLDDHLQLSYERMHLWESRHVELTVRFNNLSSREGVRGKRNGKSQQA